MRPTLLACSLLLACSSAAPTKAGGADTSATPTGDDGGDGGDGTDGGDGGDDGGGDDTATSSDDTGGPGDTGTAPEPQVVRFVAMGDGGEGNDDQYAVGRAVAQVCADKTDDRAGCEFVLYLGDNFYDDGVDSVDDEQFQSKFELPYADLDLPFYVVLGNHDYGSTSLSFWKSSYEVEYSDHSDKWNLPSEFYQFQVEHAHFFALDTNALMLESIWGDSGQDAWLRDLVATSTATWRIAFGHHPYVSNGRHGNAGAYEGYEWLPIANGASVKEFMDDRICGQVDLYLAGHDHNRQWLEPTCGTEFIVSGAAAKTTDLEDRGNTAFFEDDTTEGFVWIELRDDRLVGEFYDKNGSFEYSREVWKGAAAAGPAPAAAAL